MSREINKVRVCVPVRARRASELRVLVERAAEVADVIELRLDYLDEDQLQLTRDGLASLFAEIPRTFIVTFRPAEQGGHRALSIQRRVSFWRDFFTWFRETKPLKATLYVDIELDLFESLHSELPLEIGDGRLSIICSLHDFGQTPTDLDAIYTRMARTNARVIKLAFQARDITDCVAVLQLVKRARREGREIIAVAMGEAGLLTRVLAPMRGAFLTYGSLDAKQATAPGQISARALRELYRIHEINDATLITGLVGSPVAHSLSPYMHNAAFAARNIDAVYIPFDVGHVESFVQKMAHPRTRKLEWNLRGFSVTAPHKRSIIQLLDRIEPVAAGIGAANTVVVEGDELCGYNTDAEAALQPLRGIVDLAGARIALIGAGGAARALLWGLRERGARTTMFARNVEGACETAQDFDADIAQVEGARFDGFDLVINTTPLGTRGENETLTPATTEQLRGARVAYDIVYNPTETRFLREASAAGCETIGGLSMLVAQAAEQFKLWTGLSAPIEIMRAAAEKQMQRLEAKG